METERLTYVAQLFFLGQSDNPDLTRRFLERLRAHFAQRLQALQAIDEYHGRGGG